MIRVLVAEDMHMIRGAQLHLDNTPGGQGRGVPASQKRALDCALAAQTYAGRRSGRVADSRLLRRVCDGQHRAEH
jgi:hypothetical protein